MAIGKVMTNSDYRKAEGVSSSELKQMVKSPAHYRYWKDNPDDSDTPALLFGRACHKYVLETYDFYKEFAVAPNVDRRTKEGKELWNKFVAESEGKDVITEEQFEIIDAMRNAMLATPFVGKLINGEHEVSLFWTDEDTGIKCKCRPDSLNDKLKIVVDYKTCDNAETQHFMRKAIDLGYDLQASYYLDGVKASTGLDCIFVFIAQEKKPPYAVNILQADDVFIRSGRQLYKDMLSTYKECTETGNWWGYLGAENQINSLGVPKWLENMLGAESEE